MPSRAIQVGDYVRVPWGLETVDGVVKDIYESSHGRRVVIRVTVPGASEDGETVTLPADDVELRDEAESVSPGAWLTEVQYERKLGEALQRLQRSWLSDAEVHPKEEARQRLWPLDAHLYEETRRRLRPLDADLYLEIDAGRGQGADFVVESGDRKVLIEAKPGILQNRIITDIIDQLRMLLSHMQSEDVAGLLVTDQDLTPDAQQLLRESPRLRAVRWRGPHDDKRLATVLTSLLGKQ
jgi:hypothetical protein